MSKRIAMVLSGCGHRDGTEITEAVSAVLALDELGVDIHFFAPDVEFKVTDHLTATASADSRNTLRESARIARGNIQALDQLRAADFDAVTFPGGFGAAVNLSSWAECGANGVVSPEVARVIAEFYALGKPIGAICIAPVLVAKVLGDQGISLTLGRDQTVAAEVAKTGAHFEPCAPDDFISDRAHRVVTTPAYMDPKAKPFMIYTGIRKAMRELVEMA